MSTASGPPIHPQSSSHQLTCIPRYHRIYPDMHALHLPRTHLPPRRPPSLLPPREGRHIECVLNVLRVVLPEGPLVYESLWSISGLSPQRPETLIHSGVSLVYHLTGTIPNHPSFINDRSFLIDDWSFLIDDRSLLIDAYPPCSPVLTNPQSRLLKGSL